MVILIFQAVPASTVMIDLIHKRGKGMGGKHFREDFVWIGSERAVTL
jgi:hypothetical protein